MDRLHTTGGSLASDTAADDSAGAGEHPPMTAAGPWSVKGIDPKAREIAKDLARRSGMTLGEWLNQMIIEGEPEPHPAAPEPRRPLDELYREAQASRRGGHAR